MINLFYECSLFWICKGAGIYLRVSSPISTCEDDPLVGKTSVEHRGRLATIHLCIQYDMKQKKTILSAGICRMHASI